MGWAQFLCGCGHGILQELGLVQAASTCFSLGLLCQHQQMQQPQSWTWPDQKKDCFLSRFTRISFNFYAAENTLGREVFLSEVIHQTGKTITKYKCTLGQCYTLITRSDMIKPFLRICLVIFAGFLGYVLIIWTASRGSWFQGVSLYWVQVTMG